MSAKVLSVNAGAEIAASWAIPLERTAIDKRQLSGPVMVGLLGLDGDEQADRENHGGPEQAVYAYAGEDLDWWAATLGRVLRPGLFGENITTSGIDLSGAVIGETWRAGEVVLQVTSPRIPCLVFRNWMAEKGWLAAFRAARRPGAYLRVLHPGTIQAGDSMAVLSRPAGSVTVAQAFDAYYDRDLAVIERMTAVPGHNSRWDGVAGEWLAALQRVAARQRAAVP